MNGRALVLFLVLLGASARSLHAADISIYFPETGGLSQTATAPFSISAQNLAGRTRGYAISYNWDEIPGNGQGFVSFTGVTVSVPTVTNNNFLSHSSNRTFTAKAGSGSFSFPVLVRVNVYGRDTTANEFPTFLGAWTVSCHVYGNRTPGASQLPPVVSGSWSVSGLVDDRSQPVFTLIEPVGYVEVYNGSTLLGAGTFPFFVASAPGASLSTQTGHTFTAGTVGPWAPVGAPITGGVDPDLDFSSSIEAVETAKGAIFAGFAAVLVISALEPLMRINEWKSSLLR